MKGYLENMIKITNDLESLKQLEELGNDVIYEPFDPTTIQFGESDLYILNIS